MVQVVCMGENETQTYSDEGVFRITVDNEVSDKVPLLCGACEEPIRIDGTLLDSVSDAECGCDEMPAAFTFLPMYKSV